MDVKEQIKVECFIRWRGHDKVSSSTPHCPLKASGMKDPMSGAYWRMGYYKGRSLVTLRQRPNNKMLLSLLSCWISKRLKT